MTALSASVYAADPFRLAEEIEAVSGSVESFHLDVMDGVFAPEYGLTARVVKALSECSPVPLDIHLMVAKPKAAVIRFSEMGIRSIAIHTEVNEEFAELSAIARGNGAKFYAALRHTTPIAALQRDLAYADGCLLLTAPAGGGTFDVNTFDRLAQRPAGLYTVVDGKIGPDHFQRLADLNVDLAVVGAALFADGEAGKKAKAFAEMLTNA